MVVSNISWAVVVSEDSHYLDEEIVDGAVPDEVKE